MSTLRSYRDLDLGQQAMTLARLCYDSTERHPVRATYGLANQIHRAAVSLALNIREGHSRRARQACLNHLSIAPGSKAELETQIELSRQFGFLSQGSAKEAVVLAEAVRPRLHALIRSLEEKQMLRGGGAVL